MGTSTGFNFTLGGIGYIFWDGYASFGVHLLTLEVTKGNIDFCRSLISYEYERSEDNGMHKINLFFLEYETEF